MKWKDFLLLLSVRNITKKVASQNQIFLLLSCLLPIPYECNHQELDWSTIVCDATSLCNALSTYYIHYSQISSKKELFSPQTTKILFTQENPLGYDLLSLLTKTFIRNVWTIYWMDFINTLLKRNLAKYLYFRILSL